MSIVYWPIPPDLERDVAENYRTAFALNLASHESLEIIRELTFDGTAPNITVEDIDGLFRYLERNFLKRPLSGVGVEVGAGPLVFSSVLARRSAVEKMYGVEVCRSIVEHLYPKMAQYILNGAAEKTIAAVGSFDDMQLPDGSVDFVLDFLSLHHSSDINVTLAEIRRVLKPDGVLLMLDKARSDNFTDGDLNQLMDQEYNAAYKNHFGLPLEQRLTRRMNGEREYRVKDWRDALGKAGLGEIVHYNLERTSGGGRFGRTTKTLMALLPVQEQAALTGLFPQRYPNHRFFLSRENRVYVPALNNFRKEISLIIARP